MCTLLLTALVACGSNGINGPGNTNPAPTEPTTDSVSGTVTFKGAPLAGVTVTLWSTNTNVIVETTTTDAQGNYTLAGLSAWQTVAAVYQFWASKPGYGFYPSVGSGATVIRFDHTGQFQGNGVTDTAIYFTLIQFTATPNTNLAGADFAAFDGSNPVVRLAATGQSVRYADGDDAALQQGVAWPASRFVDNQDGSVTDRLTGLIWLRDAGCLTPAIFAAALTEVNQLATGSCGLSDRSKAGDWRLPNLNELESLLDLSASNPALPVGAPFQNTSSAIYWSSTSYFGGQAGSPNAWAIRLSDGRFINDSVNNLKATASNAVWAVRGAGGGAVTPQSTGQYVTYAKGDDGSLQTGVPAPWLRWLDNGNGTVTDTDTGLIWLKKADCVNQDWADAVAQVRSLASGQCGLSDGSTAGNWRMPNRNEMQSLSDRMENNHADFFDNRFIQLDGSVFQQPILDTMVVSAYYWTSSTDAADPSEAWTVFSCDFGVYDVPKSQTGYTLAVR